MSTAVERYIIPNIARALKILDFLSKCKEGETISGIAQNFGIPVNSTFRIIKSLEVYGYVEEAGHRYFTTPRLLYLGYAGLNQKGLIQNSISMMRKLRDDINETVLLGTMVANEIVIIEQLPSFEFIKFTIEIGHRVPVHASAPGKAVLAFMPGKERISVLEHLNYERFNDNTIPCKNDMLDEIDKILEKGYAIDKGEELTGIICIAAPILDYRNYPVASVWTTGPDFRINKKGIDKIAENVVQTAIEISGCMGLNENAKKKKQSVQ